MAFTSLCIALAILLKVTTAQTLGTPVFAVCLDQDYPVPIRLESTDPNGAVDCATSCFVESYNYIYSYYQASTTRCLCSDTGPNAVDYSTATDSSGNCQQFQFATYVTRSTFEFDGCFSGITGDNTGQAQMTLEGCFRFAGAASDSVVFKPAFTLEGDPTVYGGCFKNVDGSSVIGSEGTAVTCDRDTAFYTYAKVAGASVGGPSNYVKKRKRERLERDAGKVVAHCPTDMTPCNIKGLSPLVEAFECIDVRSEVESCGGCAAGVFGLYGDLTSGLGVDCTALPGPKFGAVTCVNGQCVASKCKYSYKLVGNECVKA